MDRTNYGYGDILTNPKVSAVVLSFLPKTDLLNICLLSRSFNVLGRKFLNRRRRTWFIPVLTSNTSGEDLEELEKLISKSGHSFRGIKIILHQQPRFLSASQVLHRIYQKIQVKTLVLDCKVKWRPGIYSECWLTLDDVEYFECDLLTEYILDVICTHLSERLKIIHVSSYHVEDSRGIDEILRKCQNLTKWASFVPEKSVRVFAARNKQHLITRLEIHSNLSDAGEIDSFGLNIRELQVHSGIGFEQFCPIIRSSISTIEILKMGKSLFEWLIRKKFPTMENVKLVYIYGSQVLECAKGYEEVITGVAIRRVFPCAHISLEQRLISVESYLSFAHAKYLRSPLCEDYTQETNTVNSWDSGMQEDVFGSDFQDSILTNVLITDKLFGFLSSSELLNCCLVSKAFKNCGRQFLIRSFPYRVLANIDPLVDLERLEDLEDLVQNDEHPFRGISFQFTKEYTYSMSRYPEELIKYDYLSTVIISALQRIASKITIISLKIGCNNGNSLYFTTNNVSGPKLKDILPAYFAFLSLGDLEYLENVHPYSYDKFEVGEIFAESLRNRNAPNLKTLILHTRGEITTALLEKCPSLVDWGSVVYFSESERIPHADRYSTFVGLSKEHLVRNLSVDCLEVEALLSHPSVLQYKNKIQKVKLLEQVGLGIHENHGNARQRAELENRCRSALGQFFPNAEINRYFIDEFYFGFRRV